MKNKAYNDYYLALDYYRRMIDTYVAFFIYNKEEECYEVINQDLYDHYTGEFDLDMELLEFYC